MENKEIKKKNFFDTSIYDIDLNKSMDNFYEAIEDYEDLSKINEDDKLNKLRNQNHINYYKLNISKALKLPEEFRNLIKIIELKYNEIIPSLLLTEKKEDAIMHKKLIDTISEDLIKLDKVVEKQLKKLIETNDKYQNLLTIEYFNNLKMDEVKKEEILDLYSKLINISISFSYDNYENYNIQHIRKKYINNILNLLTEEEKSILLNYQHQQLNIINNNIDKKIKKYQNYLKYLNKIILNNSKYKNDLLEFETLFTNTLNYNKNKDEEANILYKKLTKDIKIIFELLKGKILDEIEKAKENLLNSSNINLYIDKLIKDCNYEIDEENTNILNYILNNLNSNNYNIDDLKMALGLVVRNIWNSKITKVEDYKPGDDFYFICSNNQFIDEKYETILLTRNELLNTDEYFDYQIGFICNYVDNIMYITEKQNVMDVKSTNVINFKTPFDIEKEFVNFYVCNRICLDGYKTKIQAVYLIDDGNIDKLNKAKDLAYTYNLPLVIIKK